jgi:hypothetical protein
MGAPLQYGAFTVLYRNRTQSTATSEFQLFIVSMNVNFGHFLVSIYHFYKCIFAKLFALTEQYQTL